MIMTLLIGLFFGFSGFVCWMLFCGMSDRDMNTGERRNYSGHNKYDDVKLDSLHDLDSIERAYSSGKIDNFDLQQLYDDCTIDEEEAELLGGDSLDLDDDFDDSY